MTQPHDGFADGDLLDLAVPYALHALPDDERDDIESRLAHAGLQEADAFYDEVRAIRETMAVVSAVSAQEPPAELRDRLLATVAGDNVRTLPTAGSARPDSGKRWRTTVLTAAAAVVIGLGAVAVVQSLRPGPPSRPPPSRCSPRPTCTPSPVPSPAAAPPRWCSPGTRTPACW